MALRPGGFHFARSLVVSVAITVAMFIGGTSAVAATKSTTVSTTGNDISWPQCGGSYPPPQAFGIVGVNHGKANNQNLCLADELSWAATKSTGYGLPTGFPWSALYVNTGDPGSVLPVVADWPTNNVDPNSVSESPGSTNPDPYGSCTVGSTGAGSNTPACAWQYGWNRAIQDMLWLIATPIAGSVSNHPSDYWWWLDVETGNSWESDLANNVADLQGMVAAFKNTSETVTGPTVQLGGVTTVGIYSTSSQWIAITGGSTTLTFDGLRGLPDWIPGARTLSAAKANCSPLPSFTAGRVTITQWFGHPYDGDWAC